jgi:hypothetical protein
VQVRRYDVSMEPLVKAYLQNHTFQELEDEHGVCARPNATFDKFALNYDQILSKPGDSVTEQCRGMVIRPVVDHFMPNWTTDEWKNVIVGPVDVIAWPMCRFYNFGDSQVADVDWNDPELRVYEKVDGTCIICYWDEVQKKWHAGTRSVPEADLPIHANDLEIGDLTFSGLFLKALIATREEISGKPVDWLVDGPDKVIHLNKEMTYVFELVSRHNQIVVDYPDPRVYLIAARHTATGVEVPIESLRIEHVRRPRTWPLHDAVAVGAFVNMANPSELEGAVICDSKFRRMKIKSMAYVLAHRSKDSVGSSPRNALEAIIMEKIDDVIPIIPKDLADKMLKMQGAYAQYCKSIDDNAKRFREEAAGNRKRYAEQVMLSDDWTAPYFNLWENKAKSAREWIKTTCEKGKLSAGSLDTILSHLAL